MTAASGSNRPPPPTGSTGRHSGFPRWAQRLSAVIAAVMLAWIATIGHYAGACAPIIKYALSELSNVTSPFLGGGRACPGTGPWPVDMPRSSLREVSMLSTGWYCRYPLASSHHTLKESFCCGWRHAKKSIIAVEQGTVGGLLIPVGQPPEQPAVCAPFPDLWTLHGWSLLLSALLRLGFYIIFNVLPVRYLVWHSIVCLTVWRFVRRPLRSAQQTAVGPTPAVNPSRSLWLAHYLLSALATVWIPMGRTAVYEFWWWIQSARAITHSNDRYLALSIGPFGYYGVWAGAILLHVVIVIAIARRLNREKGWRPDQSQRRRRIVGYAVKSFLVLVLFSWPLVIAWINRLLPEHIWINYVPF